MKKKLLRISTTLLVAAAIVVTLANNKAKIDKAAHPVKEKITVPVKIFTVKTDSFNTSFNVNGITSPDREVKIASEVQGKLVQLNIENGDIVRTGQVIAVLDASVYTAQLNSLHTSIAKAQLDIERFTRLIEMGGASPTQLENVVLQHESLLAQRKDVLQQMSHMQIRAPFTGRIENMLVEKGSYVSFGTVLSELIDISSLKIKVYLSEQQAFSNKAGQTVRISSPVLATPVTGTITTISDKADASGKFLAEIHFSNAGKQGLKAGMLADVTFAHETTVTALSLPVSALVGTAKQGKVFVVNNGHVQQRNIKTGIATAEKVQAVEGLKAGDQVVISGQLNLEEDSAISINR